MSVVVGLVNLSQLTVPSTKWLARKRLCRNKVHHSMTAAPQVNPAPNTISRIRSPRWMRPDSTASSRAMATDAAEVLPYLWRLTKIWSALAPRRSPTASMIRWLAWCGMMHLIREISSSQRRNDSLAAVYIALTAFLKVSLPSIRKWCRRAATEPAVAGTRHPPAGIDHRSALFPSAPMHAVRHPCEFGGLCKIAAPDPSPNSTQVLRSVQSTMDESFSAPMTSTVS